MIFPRMINTNNKFTSIGIAYLLVIGGFFYIITFESKVVNAGNTIYVDDENILGPWDGSLANPYQTVQDGVDNANIGEIVFVFNGTYYEHVEVNKTISLKGEDRINTIINGGSLGDVVTINVDWVNITGFTVTKSGDSTGAGIKLFNAHNCKIINNNASLNNGNGIFLSNSNGNNILDNIIYENQITGITFSSSSNNSISNNYISNNRNGIVLDHSIDNYIINNPVISGNGNRGIYLDFSSNNTIENNTCNSNVYAGIRFDDSALNLIKNNICNLNFRGIELWGSDGNIITGNIASNNVQFGISLIDLTIGNSIAYNTANGNSWAGISLYYTSNNTIMNNTITSNLECGIYLWQSSTSNNILNNNIDNNDIGVLLEEFSNNTNIICNNITNNNMGVNIIYSFYNNIENNNISMNNEYGIRVFNSGDNKIAGNIVSNNNNGIGVEYFIGGNDIESNNISNNLIGINITTSSNDNTITANDISNNLYGIVMDSTDSNIFTRNTFKSNTLYAIDIISGEFNLIYHNNFIDNNGGGIQANDSAGMNGWYINYPTGGNYWNDWATPDTKSGPNQDQPGSDGFVDFPYYLDGGVNARDRYPFADPMDFSPPDITNLQPPDGSIINDSTPTINANYSDPSGIDTGSVVLTVNGIDVTSSATVTETGVSYIPGTALSDGIYTIYIEVQDVFGYMASETWFFTIDATPPEITNLQPPDVSTINDTTPTISADYSDPSGINISSVKLMVDGIDVTSFALVIEGGVDYLPGTALSEAIHTVYIEVRDNVGNLASITWSFTIDIVLPPPTNLITKIINDGHNAKLEWDPPISSILDHYLIYRAGSATEFDFTTPYNNSATWSYPLNTTWIDPDSGVTAVDDDFYYIVRAANSDESDISSTSNTAGIWTRTFEPGISTFSLPLEPFVMRNIEYYCQDMNACYIKWMNHTTQTWMRYNQGDSENNTLLEFGEGYEVEFDNQTRYTFWGMPGAMIIYDDDSGFSGFNPDSEARNLSLSVEPNGDVSLTWQEPSSMMSGDWYEVYYSNTRDGFFGTFGMDYDIAGPSINFGTNTATILGLGANDPGARLYFMVVPFNASGVRGSSSYSIGVWTEEYLSEYDTMGIPLKLKSYRTADWYCNNIPDCIGINYYISNDQRWGWHTTRMPAGAFDVVLEMGKGYQISTSGAAKFTFIGV